MPELPEVETIRLNLEKLLSAKTLQRIDTFTPEVLVNHENVVYAGQRLTKIERVGKYLIFHFQAVSLMIHLRMTGKLLFREASTMPEEDGNKFRFMRARLVFDDGSRLIFDDIRRFGRMTLFPYGEHKQDPGFARLGPDAMAETWTNEHFMRKLKTRKNTTIKAVLLDQTVVAGIGNIYADESLFRAGIRPNTSPTKLSTKKLSQLQCVIKQVLGEAIGLGGTSFSDYVNSFGEKGSFQLELFVYQREGLPCRTCGTSIVKTTVAGRGTRHCPHCQK